MKRSNISFILAVASTACFSTTVSAQEQSPSPWRIMPSLIYLQHFPGSTFRNEINMIQNALYYPYSTQWKYSGTGLLFRARVFNPWYSQVAFTVSGGVEWFSQPDNFYRAVPTLRALDGIGQNVQGHSFTTYPLGIGAQVFTPNTGEKEIMFFAGGELTTHLVNARVSIDEQTKLGYTLLGGFAVKFFEFGAFYSSFSDMQNLGAYLGVRFNPFVVR